MTSMLHTCPWAIASPSVSVCSHVVCVNPSQHLLFKEDPPTRSGNSPFPFSTFQSSRSQIVWSLGALIDGSLGQGDLWDVAQVLEPRCMNHGFEVQGQHRPWTWTWYDCSGLKEPCISSTDLEMRVKLRSCTGGSNLKDCSRDAGLPGNPEQK